MEVVLTSFLLGPDECSSRRILPLSVAILPREFRRSHILTRILRTICSQGFPIEGWSPFFGQLTLRPLQQGYSTGLRFARKLQFPIHLTVNGRISDRGERVGDNPKIPQPLRSWTSGILLLLLFVKDLLIKWYNASISIWFNLSIWVTYDKDYLGIMKRMVFKTYQMRMILSSYSHEK